MSVQQCLACNAVVPKSSKKTCECGHVFEDVKQIAGKRFSEYRAELYWRLENKRMEKLSKENTPCNGDQTVDQNNNADNYKSKEVGEKVSKLRKMTGRSNKLKYLQGKNYINSDI
ncbi:hypothetical protein ABFA07_022643 [Porites harrisoni]